MRTRAWIGGFGFVGLLGSALVIVSCSGNDSTNGGGTGGVTSNTGGTKATGGTATATGGTNANTGGTTSTGGTKATGGTTTGTTGGAAGATTTTGGAAGAVGVYSMGVMVDNIQFISDSSSGGNSGGGAASGGSGGASAGSSTGGASAGSSTGGAAAGGAAALCTVIVPSSPAITDFETADPETTNAGYDFAAASGMKGGTYSYPTAGSYALTSKVDSGTWTISGSVGDYSGFGVWLSCMVDGSAFTGIQFDIWGNAGSDGMVSFSTATAADMWADPDKPSHNKCAAAKADQYSACIPPSKKFKVTADKQTIAVKWTDLTGGKPEAAVNPKEIIQFQWAFTWPNTAPAGTGGSSSTGGNGGAATTGGSGGDTGGTAGTGTGGSGGDTGGTAGTGTGGNGGAATGGSGGATGGSGGAATGGSGGTS